MESNRLWLKWIVSDPHPTKLHVFGSSFPTTWGKGCVWPLSVSFHFVDVALNFNLTPIALEIQQCQITKNALKSVFSVLHRTRMQTNAKLAAHGESTKLSKGCRRISLLFSFLRMALNSRPVCRKGSHTQHNLRSTFYTTPAEIISWQSRCLASRLQWNLKCWEGIFSHRQVGFYHSQAVSLAFHSQRNSWISASEVGTSWEWMRPITNQKHPKLVNLSKTEYVECLRAIEYTA